VRPIIPAKMTYAVALDPTGAPVCEHGRWTFAGADFKRGASKWRCPTGECSPASKWVKADRRHPLIPRETKRWKDLYRGRASVEREFGRLKHEYGLAPLRVRGLAKVQLHADLTMLARLSQALARARATARGVAPHHQRRYNQGREGRRAPYSSSIVGDLSQSHL